MNPAMLELSLVALLPALLLCAYIYVKDRVEKESPLLLAVLFLSGAACYLPAVFGENALIELWDQTFSSHITYDIEGFATFSSGGLHLAHSALCSFLAVAVVEETVKFLLLFFLTWKSKHFNCLFDGIVYSTFLSLGFAAVENIRYAVLGGWDTLLLRAVTSVPGHLFFGVAMGYCYTMWHTYYLARKTEGNLAAQGKIALKKPFRSAFWLISALLVPLTVHGLYSFSYFYSSQTLVIVFYGFLALLYILSFVGIHRLSAADAESHKIISHLLFRKYPGLQDSVGKIDSYLQR